MTTVILYIKVIKVMKSRDRSHVEAVEIRCLRCVCGITKYKRVRYERSEVPKWVMMKVRKKQKRQS